MTYAMLLLAFVSGFGLNWLWVRCVAEVHARRRFSTANLSVMIYLFTIVSTYLLIEKNIPGVLCYVVGDWMGAYYSVKSNDKDVPPVG